MAAKPDTFDSTECLAKTLIDHGDDLDEVTTAPEPAKRSGEKRKFWKQKKGQSLLEPSKKQQTVAVHAATAPVATPAATPTAQ